jgi:hypothetical protein
MPKIQRYFSEIQFKNFKNDIYKGANPLPVTIRNSGGELDLQLRPGNKFNIYNKGNSLAEVQVRINDYNVKIHNKFDPIGCAGKDGKKRFPKNRFVNSGEYIHISIKREEFLKFFQKNIIQALCSNIKSVNNGEEIAFEQSLMTDNLNCEDFIIIDRQVGGGGLKGYLDLLALRRIDKGKYRFVVLEVKLGNNTELKGKVVGQIEGYMSGIKKNIGNFQKCYENNYAQKKEIGLFPDYFPNIIKIDKIVEGKIVVGLYSMIGDQYIKELNSKYPAWEKDKNIIQFKNELIGKI